ncbi:MAG: AAA family ATPase [Acidobacteriia bacterium]|nr:AAA family ATPase [Terriglobia bacterium]
MRLRDIEVQDFRKLRQVKICGLKDGVNVIAGGNEAGKSTLLAAVQAALFQRHNVSGKVLDGMQPLGCAVRPQVKLSFELDDGVYHLHKTFGGSSGSAEVIDPGGRRFSNHDADHKLEELLHFQAASKGATRFQELGIWPLFWVEQGTTFQALNINPDVRVTVQSSLRKEVGDILVGESGSRLKDRFAELYGQFFTSKTGAATGDLSAARKEVMKFEALLSNKRSELAQLAQEVAALETALARRDKLTDPALRQQIEKAKAEALLEAGELKILEQERNQVANEFRLKQALLANAQTARQHRLALVNEVSRLEQRLSESKTAHEAAERNLGQLETEFQSRIGQLDAARIGLKTATSHRVQVSRILDLVKLNASYAVVAQRLTEATSAAEKQAKARKIATAIQITTKDVERLRKLEQSLFQSEANLKAAATRIHFNVFEPSKLTVNGGAVPVTGEMLATDVVSISVEAIAEIRVSPGGEGLDARRQQSMAAQGKLASALAELAVESIEAVHELDQKRKNAESAFATHESVVRALAPDGLEALRQEVATQEEQRQALRRILGDIAQPEFHSATAAVEIAESQEQHCRSEVERLDTKVADIQTKRDEVRKLQTTKETELRSTTEDVARARNALASARDIKTDDQIIQEDTQLEADRHAAQEISARLEALYKSKDPEGIAVRVETTSAALTSLENQIADAERSINNLRVTLDVHGQNGLGEECSAIQSDLCTARARLAAVEREANAIRVAYNMIVQVEKEANTQFLQPVVRRVQPYLNRVLSGSHIQIGTDMMIEGLQRGPNTEPFECLSVGTREQLSMITRIAFADLLAEEGVDAPIILDDALVYADDERFADALATLAFAAKRHQIIILTCHEHRYFGLAGPVMRIEEQEQPASL